MNNICGILCLEEQQTYLIFVKIELFYIIKIVSLFMYIFAIILVEDVLFAIKNPPQYFHFLILTL